MAGNNEDLSMDMLDFGGFKIPEDAYIEEEKTQDLEKQVLNNTNTENVTDDNSQENVGDGTEESQLDNGNSETESPANSDENVFNSLVSFLSERGLISDVSEEDIKKINTDSDFEEFMRKQNQSLKYQGMNDHQIKYLNGLENGLPEEEIKDYIQSDIAFEKLTDEVIENNAGVRRDLIIQGYLAKGFDEGYATKQFQRVSDSGEDVEEAKMFKETLKQIRDQQYQAQIENNKRTQEEAQKAYDKQINDFKESVYKKDKIFDEIAVTQGMKDKVYELMTKPVAYAEDNRPINAFEKSRLENPIDFLTNMYYAYELTNGFKDMKKLVAKATTKSSNTFKSKLQRNNFIFNSQSNPNLDNDIDAPNIVDID